MKLPKLPRNEKINPKEVLTQYQRNMQKSLTNQGVIFFDTENGRLNIDDSYLTLPSNITDIPSHELGEYLNAFTQHKVYMRTVLGRVELLAEEARRDYYEASNPIYRKYATSKMSETSKERIVNSDPDVKIQYDFYSDVKRQLAIVQYSLENVEDIIFLISREVTRREADFNNERRNSNIYKG